MDQPTGDQRPRPAAPARPPAPPPAAPAKNRTGLYIALGVAGLVVVGAGLYFESSGEVGKVETLKPDTSELGELRGRTLKEISDFETELRGMNEETAQAFRARTSLARQAALKANNMKEMLEASAILKSARDSMR